MTIGLLAGLHHHELAKKGGKAWAVTYHGGCRCQSFPMEKTSFKRDDRVERELFGFCRMNWMEWASLWDELKPHDVSAHLIRSMQCVLYFPATRSKSKAAQRTAMGLKLMARNKGECVDNLVACGGWVYANQT